MLDSLSQHADVLSISLDHPVRALLNISAPAVGANYWWSNGFTGPGWYDVGVLDTGIDFRSDNGLSGHQGVGDERTWFGSVTTDDHTSNQSGHGTPIAGIIASTGSTQYPQYKGVAYGIRKIINGRVLGGAGLESWVWDAIEWAVNQSTSKAESINLSLEVAKAWPTYDYSSGALTKYVDFYVDTLDVPIVIATGNDGTLGLTKPADAYNGIAVGNIDDRSTISTNDDRLVASSSRGPLPGGGRRKPDLVAPGKPVTSSARVGGFLLTGPDTQEGGTSFAAPHVTGGVALVESVLSHEPYTIKALLLDTATDRFNPNNSDDALGWDGNYGYGCLNLYRAYYFRYVYPRTISPGQSLYFTGTISMGSGDLGKMTIVWHKHLNAPVGNDPPSELTLSDLDLYLYDYTNNQQGALLASSISTIDNVEQVIYNGPSNRTVLVKVSAVSTYNGGPEGFTLASMHPLTQIASPAPAAIALTSGTEAITNALGNNFPNPFNPDTWIPFALAKEAVVKIQIFDTQGKLVRTLGLGQKPAGQYFTKEKAVYWDGRNDQGERVASGTYFYYLEAGKFKATRKMVIQK